MRSVTVHHGDSREVLKGLADASVHAVVCDPPYALVSIGKRYGGPDAKASRAGVTGAYARASAGFMGQTWDTGETAFSVEFWGQVLRVLKPGGHVAAFSGTRTYHRLACAVEDAGFEIRDMLAWMYGSGFPKSHDVSKGIDRAAGAERQVLAAGDPVRRMVPGADQNKAGWVKDNGRTFTPTVTAAATPEAQDWEGWGTALKPALEPIVFGRKPLAGTVAANVLAHGVGALNVDGCRIEGETWPASGAQTGGEAVAVFGGGLNNSGRSGAHGAGRWPANVIHDGSDEVVGGFPRFAGEGSAARFFYNAKADAEDRLGSKHPTVKPVDLMAWLCRLVTPPGGVILDPFAGSGTTGLAAMREGFDAILIEREAQYVADIERRLAWARGEGRLTAQEKLRPGPPRPWARSICFQQSKTKNRMREAMTTHEVGRTARDLSEAEARADAAHQWRAVEAAPEGRREALAGAWALQWAWPALVALAALQDDAASQYEAGFADGADL